MISVVIPNWNGQRFLKTCLDSLRNQTYRDIEVILVDNGSRDGSVEFTRNHYPEVKVISFPENRGFSAAVNAGIQVSRGEYIALLNNDTEADPNWLAEAAKVLDERQDIGFCASKMLRYYERHIIDGAGDLYLPTGGAFRYGSGEIDGVQFDRPYFVFGACAGAAVYRRKLFEDVGLFDEDFFAYYEDVDLSFRALLKGYRCIYVPTAVVYHIGSGTSGGRQNPRTVFLLARNYISVLVKNYLSKLFIRNVFLIMRYMIFNIYYLARDGNSAFAYVAGLLAGLKQLPIMLKKRRSIQASRQVPVSAVAQSMEQALEWLRESERRRTVQAQLERDTRT